MENQPTPAMLYVVASTTGGYAREDAAEPHVCGVFTDENVAKKVAMVGHGKVFTMPLDQVGAGYIETMRAMGIKLPGITEPKE